MGFYLYPALVFSFFLGIYTTMQYQASASLPSVQKMMATQNAQLFVSYKNAVASFHRANPAFTGSVSASALAAQGTPFSSTFLASTGNIIVNPSGNVFVVICYMPLDGGSAGLVPQLAGNDFVSIGSSDGSPGGTSNTWHNLATANMTLPVSVPSANLVSVIQTGN